MSVLEEEGIGVQLYMPVYAMLVLATEVSALSTVYHMQTLIVVLAYTMNVLLRLNYIYFAFDMHHFIPFRSISMGIPITRHRH